MTHIGAEWRLATPSSVHISCQPPWASIGIHYIQAIDSNSKYPSSMKHRQHPSANISHHEPPPQTSTSSSTTMMKLHWHQTSVVINAMMSHHPRIHRELWLWGLCFFAFSDPPSFSDPHPWVRLCRLHTACGCASSGWVDVSGTLRFCELQQLE